VSPESTWQKTIGPADVGKTQGNEAAVCSRPGVLNSDDYVDVHEWRALGDPLVN
jgi:hypothetical protein